MKKHILYLALFLCAAYSYAAPALETDPSVASGTLDCGLNYYMVTNDSRVGLADFALAIRYDSPQAKSEVPGLLRRSLDSLPHFRVRTPSAFLLDNGIRFSRSGYVSAGKDAAMLHLRNVAVNRSDKMVDSTLLFFFDIVSEAVSGNSGGMRNASGPGSCAVIVSGNVDKDEILKKMNMLSLMIDRSAGTACPVADSIDVQMAGSVPESGIEVHTGSSGLSSVSAVFYGTKIPENLRGTALSLISDHFYSEFRTVAERRTVSLLRNRGIPYASVRCSRSPSAESGESDRFSISVLAATDDTSAVKAAVAEVLGELRDKGVSEQEYSFASYTATRELYFRSIASFRENSDYVRKCFSAFVYGSPVFSTGAQAAFFMEAALPDTTGRRLLNEYLAGLIPDFPEYAGGSPSRYEPGPGFEKSDTLLLSSSFPKVKLRKTRQSKTSDGKIMYFSNGMIVVYKQMPTDGNMYYSWVIRGGFSSVPDLQRGEGAFYSDILMNGKICGLEGPAFLDLLRSEGISADAGVGISDIRISGTAPVSRMTLLLKALTSFSRSYEEDDALGSYHLECEKLRLSSMRGEYVSRVATIDSIMCPDYRYSSSKSLSGIYANTVERAGDFFRTQFAKSNDGVLVLVGDMEEFELKKVLESYLGGFRTAPYVVSRPSVVYQPVSGWSTYVSDGRSNSIDVVLSSRIVLNSVNYMSAQIAAMLLRDTLAGALYDCGMTVDMKDSCSVFPHERFTVSLSAVPAALSGLGASVSYGSYFRSLYSSRAALYSLVEGGIDDATLSVYKKELLDRYDSGQKDPVYWLDLISDRVSTGKDLDSGYKDKIASVTTESVMKVLSGLDEGGKVEYVIKKD